MSFMEKQVTGKQRWLKVETNQGTEFLPIDLVGDLPNSEFLADGVTEDNSADIQEYCEGKVESWENIQGFGARLSAPGYLDCTPWSVFDSAEDAQSHLDDTYDED